MATNQRGVRPTASDSEQRADYALGAPSMTSSIFVRAVASSACGTGRAQDPALRNTLLAIHEQLLKQERELLATTR